ncbi:MAG: alpha/beta hydrolase [Oscillospiraceae bacterium]|nr:alpha/beta hydrolase [Oscillospiraceae bacterium]
MKKKAVAIAAVAGGVGAVLVGGAYATYRFGFYSPNANQNLDRSFGISDQTRPIYSKIMDLLDDYNAIPFERVYMQSYDGLRLTARYYESKPGAPLCICCHGWRSTPARDFCGATPMLLKHGYNLLLIEQRAMGGSEGHTMTYGVKERFDARDWAKWAVERFGKDLKIVLIGVSMGAATVLMSADLDLPENVKGIVADCPFDAPHRIQTKVGMETGFPLFTSLLMATLAARLFGGFSVFGSSAMKAVKKATVPIMIFHGDDDQFVPEWMSANIAKKNPEKIERYLFHGAGHALSYMVDPERYEKLLTGFLSRVLA